MSDEYPSDLRWLVERIDRNHAETTADIARLEARVEAIPSAMDRYVLQRVYEAERDADRGRIKRLEETDTSDRANGRSWVLGLVLAVVGAACGVLAQLLIAKGGH